MNELGKMMFERRKELNLTLEDVGNAVGVGKSTVRKWENGLIKNMGRDKIALLAKVLQLPPVLFVPSDDQPPAFSEEEMRLVRLYRSATPEGKRNAFVILEANQKKDSERMAT